MYKRENYLNKLLAFKDQREIIKVITGIRRCGKSSLMKLFQMELLEEGIFKDNIIHINFEDMKYDEIDDYKKLNSYIESLITNKNNYYLLLDEVQNIEKWEKVINSLRLQGNIDIYITGSNAYLLSSELSTLLSGRYVELKMLPLSFKEFVEFNNYDENKDKEKYFDEYLKIGGFPGISLVKNNEDIIDSYLSGILNTVIVKDVVQRNDVRDVSLLENLIKFLADNIGNPLSIKKISDYLTSAGRKTSSETIDNYIKMLESAYIFYKAKRYDIKGKLYLKTLEKFYLVDAGLRQILLKKGYYDYGHIIENIVYFELLNRGYEVSIGKIGSLEVDFIAEKSNEKIYYQVSTTLKEEKTFQREISPFESIKDHHKKVILTMDNVIDNNYKGIIIQNILEFLLLRR